uniref:Potassium-transporting ATPase subunit KdpB n=1 Tax=Candidatus Aschnera chinzeii TaxID=1485666 RepID=A0AAT9G4J8_9ENTR|nr:MAG: potassium-transporting ATPase subunit KdpB [Candidatus Aschnera chinzeii]
MKINNNFLTKKIIYEILKRTIKKCAPKVQWRNPVLFTAYLSTVLITIIFIYQILYPNYVHNVPFNTAIIFCLWLAILIGNFLESFMEIYCKTQWLYMQLLRKYNNRYDSDTISYLNKNIYDIHNGDYIFVTVDDIIPCNGKIIKGQAFVNINGINAYSMVLPNKLINIHDLVIMGSKVVSGWLIIQCVMTIDEYFLIYIKLILSGNKVYDTPHELSLKSILFGLTIIFSISCLTLYPFIIFNSHVYEKENSISIVILVSLLICLIPTTTSSLLSCINIANIIKMFKVNIIVANVKILEMAASINAIFIKKNNFFTIMNSKACKFFPATGVTVKELAYASLLSSIVKDTMDNRSIMMLANKFFFIEEQYQLYNLYNLSRPFSTSTGITGINVNDRLIIKGHVNSIRRYLCDKHIFFNDDLENMIRKVSIKWEKLFIVLDNNRILGIVALKYAYRDIKENILHLKRMGIKTILIIDDDELIHNIIKTVGLKQDNLFKIQYHNKISLLINKYISDDKIIAISDSSLIKDRTLIDKIHITMMLISQSSITENIANIIDFDSDPSKIIKIIQLGKELLINRSSIFIFSITNDIVKYCIILPMIFSIISPQLSILNVMKLNTPSSAILSTLIFNAVIIIFLLPVIIKSIDYKILTSKYLLCRNLFIYGCSGLIIPVVAIKLIDLLINLL